MALGSRERTLEVTLAVGLLGSAALRRQFMHAHMLLLAALAVLLHRQLWDLLRAGAGCAATACRGASGFLAGWLRDRREDLCWLLTDPEMRRVRLVFACIVHACLTPAAPTAHERNC